MVGTMKLPQLTVRHFFWLFAPAVVLLYTGAYLTGSYEEWPHPNGESAGKTFAWRCYPTDFHAVVFWPAAKVESIIRGFTVMSLRCKGKPR